MATSSSGDDPIALTSRLATFNKSEQVAIVVCTKLAACTSIVCSSYLIRRISRDKERRRHVKDRLLLSMCLLDVIFSLSYFVGSWAFPSDIEVWGASGNDTTCTIEGVFYHFGMMEVLYNAALGLYFLLAVKFRFQDQRLKIFENLCHLLFLGYGLFVCIYSVVQGNITPSESVCLAWYPFSKRGLQGRPLSSPPIQPNSTTFNNGTQPFPGMMMMNNTTSPPAATRPFGGHQRTRVFLAAIPITFSIVFSSTMMLILIFHVWITEWRMRRYSSTQFSNSNNTLGPTSSGMRVSKQVAIQGILYMASFVVCWVPTLINNTIVRRKQGQKIYFVPQFIASVATPLQGLFIMIVYEWAKNIRLRQPPVNSNAGSDLTTSNDLELEERAMQGTNTISSDQTPQGSGNNWDTNNNEIEEEEVFEA